MADSEGTWQIGTITGANFALEDYGTYSPSAAVDTWALAASSVQPVVGRAHQRVAQQVVELAAGERAFTHGILIDADRLLRAGANAAESTIDGVRLRRPAEVRCTYDGGATTGVLYPRLAFGFGSDATLSTESITISGVPSMRLVTVVVNCISDVPGLTDIVLEDMGGVIATAPTIDLASGVNVIDFLTEAGAHTIPAGGAVAISLDTVAAHGVIAILLQFEEVPA